MRHGNVIAEIRAVSTAHKGSPMSDTLKRIMYFFVIGLVGATFLTSPIFAAQFKNESGSPVSLESTEGGGVVRVTLEEKSDHTRIFTEEGALLYEGPLEKGKHLFQLDGVGSGVIRVQNGFINYSERIQPLNPLSETKLDRKAKSKAGTKAPVESLLSK